MKERRLLPGAPRHGFLAGPHAAAHGLSNKITKHEATMIKRPYSYGKPTRLPKDPEARRVTHMSRVFDPHFHKLDARCMALHAPASQE